MLSQKRDMEASKAFFQQALEIAEAPPEQMVTDGLTSYPRAISEVLGKLVKHEQRSFLGNPVEPSHGPIKARYYPILDMGLSNSAKQLCEVFDEMNQYLKHRRQMKEYVCLSNQRTQFQQKVQQLETAFLAA